MLNISFTKGKMDFIVDNTTKSFTDLKNEQYCLSYENFKLLLNGIKTIQDKNVRSTVEWHIRKIYQFTFQGELKIQPIEQHSFYKK